MKTRMFANLPLDINLLLSKHLVRVSDSIFNELMHVRGVNVGARNMLDHYLRTNAIALIANMPRAEIARFLQNYYALGSQPLADLKLAADAAGANHATYALYALVVNVNELDAVKLLAAINNLRQTGFPQRIITSLEIIHHFITHDINYDAELVNLLKAKNIAYINFRGANLVANFTNCDLSFADLRNTNFFCCVTSANLEGANLCDAVVNEKSVFYDTITTNLKCDRLINKGMALEEEEDQQSGELRPVIPEFAHLYQRKDEPKPKSGFCNIL